MNTETVASQEKVIGVVSDTHIPDQVAGLHPDLIPGLRQAGVELILHAGDISSLAPLDMLAEVAPVEAVAGNRDIFYRIGLPVEKHFVFNGVKIYLSHGHGTFFHYLWDKGIYMLKGYEFDRYFRWLRRTSGRAEVVIFGHTHRAENRLINGKLYFNPGSAGPNYYHSRPSYGVLRIDPEGKVRGEIHYLENYPLRNNRWTRG